MDVFEAIRTMQAVRQYQDRPVPEEVLRRVLEAGRLTASGMNAQPWHFIVVEDRDTLRQLGALAKTGPYIAQAPVAIAVGVDRTRLAISDASRAIHAMLLTAWSDGVGGNWVGFGGLDQAKSVLGIPEQMDLLAILPLGYPAAAIGRGKKERKPLAELPHGSAMASRSSRSGSCHPLSAASCERSPDPAWHQVKVAERLRPCVTVPVEHGLWTCAQFINTLDSF